MEQYDGVNQKILENDPNYTKFNWVIGMREHGIPRRAMSISAYKI